jgi:hypothetical protein
MTPEQLEFEAEALYMASRPRHDSSVCWCCGQSLFGSHGFDLVRDMSGAQQLAHKRCATRYGQNQRMAAGPRWAEISEVAKNVYRAYACNGERADLF